VPNHLRFRISPEMTIVLGATVMDLDDKSIGQQMELTASRRPAAGEMDAYERVLTDAVEGDATLFAREDYVEEAWRIIDPALKADTPVLTYEPGTWGPAAAARAVGPKEGWSDLALESNRLS
jgi:glucose-6-phosphate 1-dehydrogenase